MFRFDYVFLNMLGSRLRRDGKKGQSHFLYILFRILADQADVQDLKMEIARLGINLEMVPLDLTVPRGDPSKPVQLDPEGVEDVRAKLARFTEENVKELLYNLSYLVLAFKTKRDQKIVADALGIKVTTEIVDENDMKHTVQ